MAKKRANGEGSISRRKDGRWEYAIVAPLADGSRKKIRRYAPTRAEADARLTELKRQIQNDTPLPDRTWRLGGYLDYWLESQVRTNRRAATYAQCETIVRIYLKPALGSVQLSKLTVPVVQAFLNRQTAKGVSLPTVHVIRKVLSAALTRAMREELLMRNVARLTELTPWESRQVLPWSLQEAVEFLNKAQAEDLAPAYLLLLVYGLRRGELLGLTWSDVDFEKGIIRVRRQLQQVGSKFSLAPLKTRASRRDLPLISLVRDVLLKHHQQQALALGSRVVSDYEGEAGDLVFTTGSGNAIQPKNFARSFQRACERYGVRLIRVHDIRHTTATLLKNFHVPDRDIQIILGHSRISITQETYEHDDMTSRTSALELVEAAFGSGNGVTTSVRSRHDLPSTMLFSQQNDVSKLWWSYRDSNPGPLPCHGVSLANPLSFSAVRQHMRASTCAMLAGLVAVKSSRQKWLAPPHAQIRRAVPTAACGLHVARCEPSLRQHHERLAV